MPCLICVWFDNCSNNIVLSATKLDHFEHTLPWGHVLPLFALFMHYYYSYYHFGKDLIHFISYNSFFTFLLPRLSCTEAVAKVQKNSLTQQS